MYDAVNDPYCYSGTKVLKNWANIRRARELRQFELVMTTQRFDEPLPGGRFSVSYYCAVHHHLFQDVYSWAGKFRSVRISRRGSAFCYPENIAREMRRLFADLGKRRFLRGLSQKEFAIQAAHFLAETERHSCLSRWQWQVTTRLCHHACRPCRTSVRSGKIASGQISESNGGKFFRQ